MYVYNLIRIFPVFHHSSLWDHLRTIPSSSPRLEKNQSVTISPPCPPQRFLQCLLSPSDSDPAKTPLGSSRAPNRSPALMQAFGRTQSSKENEGGSGCLLVVGVSKVSWSLAYLRPISGGSGMLEIPLVAHNIREELHSI